VCNIALCILQQKLMDFDRGVLGTIDFDDQIWLPVVREHLLPIPDTFNYSWIFLDEVQDISPVQFQLLHRVFNACKNARILAAGDGYQAIYGFRGADKSIDKLKEFPGKITRYSLPLCRRCPKNHVAIAKLLLPSICTFDENGNGKVNLVKSFDSIATKDWILCRYMKPIVVAAFELIKTHLKPVCIIGEKDVKEQLKTFFQNLNNNTTVEETLQKAENELKREKKYCFETGTANKIPYLEDLHECICFLAKKFETKTAVLEFIKEVFKKKTGKISCSTVHRAKGQSIKANIWVLATQKTPTAPKISEFTKEERNIWYVALTRCKYMKENDNCLNFYLQSNPTPNTENNISAMIIPQEFYPLLKL